MRVGIDTFVTDTSIGPVALAAALEERGFDSVFLAEHSHIPSARTSPWPGGDVLPDHYSRTLDVFMALAMMATATQRLRLGTGITLVAQHDPIWLAKQVATLDLVSDGRADFGIGFGWNREEMEHHGVDYRTRRRLVTEKIEMMKALWSADEASYQGELVSLDPSWAWPKPIQEPHPPIFIGSGLGPKTMELMVRHCSGWMPIAGRHDLKRGVAKFRSDLEDAGEDPDAYEVIVYASKADDSEWASWRSAGVTRVLLNLPSVPEAEARAVLDGYARLVDR